MLDLLSVKKCRAKKAVPKENLRDYSIVSRFDSISARICLERSTRQLPQGGPTRLSSRLPEDALSVAERVGTRRRLPMAEALTLLSELNDELDRLDAERDALIALHQQIKQKASRVVDDTFDVYEERQLAHVLLEAPDALLIWINFVRVCKSNPNGQKK